MLVVLFFGIPAKIWIIAFILCAVLNVVMSLYSGHLEKMELTKTI